MSHFLSSLLLDKLAVSEVQCTEQSLAFFPLNQ